MTTWLKQSTAVTVPLGPFVDSTDGFTAETALSIAQADVQLSKNGAAFAQKNSASSLSHMTGSFGFYPLDLNATDTNTLGMLTISVNKSGALPVFKEYMIIPPAVYNALVAAIVTLNANVAQWNSVDVATTNPITESVIEGSTTIKTMWRVIYAVLAGKAAGMGTTTATFRDIADTKNRVSATVDTSGNRTAVTVDGS